MKIGCLLLILLPSLVVAQPVPSLPPLPDQGADRASGQTVSIPHPATRSARANRVGDRLLELHSVSVAEAVELIHSQMLHSPYVLDPEVLNDSRLVSFSWDGRKENAETFVRNFLDQLGYVREKRGTVSFIQKKSQTGSAAEPFVYRPLHRSVTFISELLGPMFTGRFSVNRGVTSVDGAAMPVESATLPGTAAAVINRSADLLVFSGPAAEIERLKKVLPQVDLREGEIVVRGLVYEVGSNASEGSAFNVITNLLGGALSLSLDPGAALSNAVRIKGASIDVIASMLSSNYRFKVVSSPSMRIRSGAQGSFSVGEDVPVLGAIQQSNDQRSIQSIEYRSSGVIFEVVPTVHDKTIELDIRQELSNFVRTETGVNDSPTLTKRSLKTSVSLNDGDLIVLGGLADEKVSNRRSGPSFLFDFANARTAETSRSEIVLVLQVQRVPI
jgi:hypothetical protein